jgi:hypothetical protein
MEKQNLIALMRIGNVQMAIERHGDGIQERPVARIGKVVEDDDARRRWEMEDLLALRELCNRAINDAYRMQTIVPAPQPEHGEESR